MIVPSTPTTFEDIDNLIGSRIVELLQAYCHDSLTGMPEASAYLAGEIRQGLFQQNPVKARIAILVHTCNPDEMGELPSSSNALPRGGQLDQRMLAEPFEIGGGVTEWHTFTLEIVCNFTRTSEDRDTARRIGFWVIGRAKQAIRNNPGLSLRDDFGCSAKYIYVHNEHKWEEGGPPKDFIWKAKIMVSALVEVDTPGF